MGDIVFRTAWMKNDPAIAGDAREFWLRLNAMPPQDIDGRLKQLCATAFDGDKMVAVSTVDFSNYAPLRSRFFYYRTTVDPEFRRRGLASRLCIYSRNLLAQWSDEHPEEKMKGLLVILQAPEFRFRDLDAVFRQFDLELTLVGYTQDGYRVRVQWFPQAKVE